MRFRRVAVFLAIGAIVLVQTPVTADPCDPICTNEIVDFLLRTWDGAQEDIAGVRAFMQPAVDPTDYWTDLEYKKSRYTTVLGSRPPVIPRSKSGSVAIPTALPYSETGCWGQSQRPHASKHYPGTIAAVGRTFCTSPKPAMWVHSILRVVHGGTLMRVDEGWAGPSQTVSSDGFYEARVTLSWDCPSFDASLSIFSEHWVQFQDGSWGYAETSNYNEQRIRC